MDSKAVIESRELTDGDLEAVTAGVGKAVTTALLGIDPFQRRAWNHRQQVKSRWLLGI